jgi:signal transduction histidine kinase
MVGSTEVLIQDFNTRRDLLAKQNRFREALQFSIRANELKDSIHETDLARRFVNLEKIEEIEQRDLDIQELQKNKQLSEHRINLQEARLDRQSILIVAGTVVIILLGVLALAYYRFYSRIKILNVSITDKNTRIQAQADELHRMNLELKQLYGEVSEQKEEIQIQADKLADSNRNISDMNRQLEKTVEEKTLELRKTNNELVKHNGELLQFSYTVSHNLRGPVARLLGLAELVQIEKDENQTKQLAGFISRTAGDLDVIIKDLSKILELRNETHRHRETVDLAGEWERSLSLLQEGLTGNETIEADFGAAPQIVTVRAMLQSIFYNLLSNAIKFRSPERSLNVKVVSHSHDGNIFLEVADNGLGFNTRLHHEKLFKLYRRFHTHVEGRGLGLYLVKAQVDVLHGTVEVDSEPGKGSVFRVVLPLQERENGIVHPGENS